MPTPLIPDMAVFQRRLATLPLATYQAGETVLSAASTTGRLLILKEGAVAVVKEGVEIARVTEPGAVFGELSVLLDQPHTADVRALEASQFHVADAATILRVDPTPRADRCAALLRITGRPLIPHVTNATGDDTFLAAEREAHVPTRDPLSSRC